MNNISDEEAKIFVDKTFGLIKTAKTIDDLKNILKESSLLTNYMIDNIKYPKIDFQISSEEIKELKNKNFITKEDKFSSELASKNFDTLTKLLYALAWKNGDLVKVHHIVKGILSSNDQDIYEEDAIVF